MAPFPIEYSKQRIIHELDRIISRNGTSFIVMVAQLFRFLAFLIYYYIFFGDAVNEEDDENAGGSGNKQRKIKKR